MFPLYECTRDPGYARDPGIPESRDPLAGFRSVADLGRPSPIFGRILKRFPGFVSLAETLPFLFNTLCVDRSRLVALEEAPEEPIYRSEPEIYRPGPRTYSPGRIWGPSAFESDRENKSGGRADSFTSFGSSSKHTARIVRNRCVPVCGYRAGYFGFDLAQR